MACSNLSPARASNAALTTTTATSTNTKVSSDGHDGHRRRLRERFDRAGFDAFAPHEVVELLLTLCIPRRDVKRPAKLLLERFGSLRGVLDAPASELRKVVGIGSQTAIALRVVRDCAALYLQQEAEERTSLTSASAIGAFLRLRFAGQNCECLDVLYLDSGRRLLPGGIERMEKGTVDSVSISPRKLAASAIEHGARFVILAHNHPGGSAYFSQSDIEMTWAARAALAAVEVELSDHILVAGGRTTSMKAEGLIAEGERERMVAESQQSPYGRRD